MTTSQHRTAILDRIANTRDVISQAAAEGRVARGETPTWRENALERMAELFMAGDWEGSKRVAKQFEEA